MSKSKQFVNLAAYAKLCKVGPSAVTQRLKKSFEGGFEEGDPRYLEACEHDKVDGVFIDTKKYPPQRFNKSSYDDKS